MIKLKQILTLLLVAISTCINAQLPVPTLKGSAKYSAINQYFLQIEILIKSKITLIKK